MRAIGDARVALPAGRAADHSIDGAAAAACTVEAGTTDPRALVIEIVERATSIRERLNGDYRQRRPGECARARGIVAAWRSSAARGDAATFARRLALDGLEISDALRAAAPASIASAAALPEWASLLERYMAALERCEPSLTVLHQGIPFAPLLEPLVEIVDGELDALVGEAAARVSPAARRDLRTSLLKRLSRVSAPVLQERFEVRRAALPDSERVTQRDDTSVDGPPSHIYRAFVREMLDGGLTDLFRELPCLARILTESALLWRDASAELLGRLHEDRGAIAQRFGIEGELGELLSLRAGMSDAHSGGRTVHLLTFSTGDRLVYKPRGLGIDAAFARLLSWMALRGAPIPPPDAPTFAARVLDRGTHGWAEVVERAECSDPTAVRRYYQNAGALLALLHALGSTDCHYENVVAAGERPVLVDLETLLQPEIARGDPPLDRARNLGARLLYDDSALRTGLLPAWQRTHDDEAYDTGGLSASGKQSTQFTTARWHAINSDAMRVEYRRATIGTHPNLPGFAGQVIQPFEYADDILLGFERMYRWLVAHRTALLAPDGAVTLLGRETVRFIARPSAVYDHVLRRSIARAALRDGAVRSVELELLARGLLPLSPALWPLLEDEERALERLDIPLFTLPGDAKRLTVGESSVPVTRSGLDAARARFAAMGPDDLERQLHIIRASFALRRDDELPTPSGAPVAVRNADRPHDRTPLSRSEILAAAVEIAEEIGRMSLVDCRGNVTWITTEPVTSAGHRRLQATGYGLYDGLAGIALFLAAAARCAGSAELAAVARRAIRPVRDRLHSSAPTWVEEYGIGMASGAASAVYSLHRIGTFLDDDSIVDDALFAARLLTPESIANDRGLDVLQGCAGAIFALLALHRARRADQLLDLALRCGEELLGQRAYVRDLDGTSHQAWLGADGDIRTGFAHGTAGIASALLRLHAVTGSTEYLSAALDAMRCEELRVFPERSEWKAAHVAEPGARDRHGSGDLAANWCRGVSGLGLARLASGAGSHAGELRRSAVRAISLLTRNVDQITDSLDFACCGELGVIELLLSAGLRWGDSSLLAGAHARVSAMVRGSQLRGHYRLSASPATYVYDPALFRGMAGIGYGLLRLCHPESLPSFLSME